MLAKLKEALLKDSSDEGSEGPKPAGDNRPLLPMNT